MKARQGYAIRGVAPAKWESVRYIFLTARGPRR